MKTTSKISFIFALALLATACTPGEIPGGSSSNATFVDTPGGMLAAKGESTTRVATSEEIFNSMISVTGIGQPSATTTSRYNTWHGLFSESGDADSVNAPMWLGVLNLSGEVCNDLITKEKALTASSRRIFNLVDFTKGPIALTGSIEDDVIRRLARSAWARNETPDEATAIKTALGIFSGTATTDTSRAMLMTCSAMLASLETNAR